MLFKQNKNFKLFEHKSLLVCLSISLLFLVQMISKSEKNAQTINASIEMENTIKHLLPNFNKGLPFELCHYLNIYIYNTCYYSGLIFYIV